MKITITYQTIKQTGPDDYTPYTRVIHLMSNMSLEQVYEKVQVITGQADFDGQIHFSKDDTK